MATSSRIGVSAICENSKLIKLKKFEKSEA